MDRSFLLEIIFSAIDEHNKMAPPETQVQKSMDTVLFGKNGRMDSLGLVNLIVNVEKEVNEQFGKIITLADEKAFAMESSPFLTVNSFLEYLALRVDEGGNE